MFPSSEKSLWDSYGAQNVTHLERLKKLELDLGCNLVAAYQPSVCKALGLIPRTRKEKKSDFHSMQDLIVCIGLF